MALDPDGAVLVVDDDDGMREAIERLLGAGGFLCAAYASAEALLARGGHEHALCVISDLQLKGMSGLDLLAALRERGMLAPFILITAYDKPGLRDTAIRSGAADYLTKPFRGTTFLQAVREAIRAPPVR